MDATTNPPPADSPASTGEDPTTNPPPPTPPSATPPSATPPPPPPKGRNWGRIALIVGGVIVVLAILAYIGGSDGEPTASASLAQSEPAAASEPALPSEPPPSQPAPTSTFAAFGDGDHIVGTDIQAGTYRVREPAAFCYWERLSGFGGSLDEIIANGTGGGFFTVTIAASDAGFSSQGCGDWTADLAAVIDPAGPISDDGTYIVGSDVSPGTWRSSGGSGCYAARLAGFGGTLDEVITNEISTGGELIMTIAASDVGFQTSGCGTWTKTG